jgi:hypothetical protein
VPTKPITPRLTDRLCSLAESQLQMQTARSAALDADLILPLALAAVLITTSALLAHKLSTGDPGQGRSARGRVE